MTGYERSRLGFCICQLADCGYSAGWQRVLKYEAQASERPALREF